MLNLSILGVSAEGQGLSQVLGGARHHNWSCKPPHGVKPLIDVCQVWGCIFLGLLRLCADVAC